MKPSGRLVMLLALLVAMVLAVGCASEAAALMTAMEMYPTTVNALAELRRAGLLSEEQVTVIDQWKPVARAAFDECQAACEQGVPDSGAMEQLGRALDVLIRLRHEIEEARDDGKRTGGGRAGPAGPG